MSEDDVEIEGADGGNNKGSSEKELEQTDDDDEISKDVAAEE
jgi:hypothetical protein